MGDPSDDLDEPDGKEDEDFENYTTVGTSEIKSDCRQRPRSYSGLVKIEERYGDRSPYVKWKRTRLIHAQ